MDGPGSNLTKFMSDRKKQRRNSIANLKKILAEVKEESAPSAAGLETKVKTLEKVESSQVESSILDTYAIQVNSPRAPPPYPSDKGFGSALQPEQREKKFNNLVSQAASNRLSIEEEKQASSGSERLVSNMGEGEEPKADVKQYRPRAASTVEGDDPKIVLKKYAKKSREVFELNRKLSNLQKELRKEREKSERIQQNYDTLFAQKSEVSNVVAQQSAEATAEISDLARKLSLAEQELVHSKTEYTRLHNQYAKDLAAQSNVSKKQDESYDRSELVEALESATQEVSKLTMELERRASELGNAKEELDILREFRERVFMDQNDKTRLRGMLQKSSSDLMEKDAQISFLDGQLTASRNENKKLREDYEKVMRNQGQKQLAVDELQRDKDILTSQVEQYKNNERIEKQLKKELQNLAIDLSAKHEQNKQMLQQISEKEQVFQGRHESVGSLERELALTRNALQQTELERDRAVQQKMLHHEELLQLREEADSMAKAKKQLGQLSKAFEKLPSFSVLAKKGRRYQTGNSYHPNDHPVHSVPVRDLNPAFGGATSQTPHTFAAPAEGRMYSVSKEELLSMSAGRQPFQTY